MNINPRSRVNILENILENILLENIYIFETYILVNLKGVRSFISVVI